MLKSHGRAEGPWPDPGTFPLAQLGDCLSRIGSVKRQLKAACAPFTARVIMIGSVDGIRVPALETYAYSASKAALHQMSRVLAGQLGKRGITCNTLACGKPYRLVWPDGRFVTLR